jgi:threonine/homoserine/homoserine lactone efflux protein
MEAYFLFLGVSLLAALSPGMTVLLITSNALKRGMSSAIKAILGVETANLTFIVFSAAGLTALLVACQPLFTAVRWAGALYLIYLGLRLLRDAFRPPASMLAQPATVLPSQHAYWQGLTTGLGNPKALIYWTALFPQFLDSKNPALNQYAVLGMSAVVLETIVLLGYSIAAAAARGLVRRSTLARWLDAVAGAFFILIGVTLGTKQAESR